MDDSTNTTPRNGATNRMWAGIHSDEQPLSNGTLNRTNERTCTLKLTFLTLVEKQETYHSNIGGKARLHQCQHVVAEVRAIHKNDQGRRFIKNDE